MRHALEFSLQESSPDVLQGGKRLSGPEERLKIRRRISLPVSHLFGCKALRLSSLSPWNFGISEKEGKTREGAEKNAGVKAAGRRGKEPVEQF